MIRASSASSNSTATFHSLTELGMCSSANKQYTLKQSKIVIVLELNIDAEHAYHLVTSRFWIKRELASKLLQLEIFPDEYNDDRGRF